MNLLLKMERYRHGKRIFGNSCVQHGSTVLFAKHSGIDHRVKDEVSTQVFVDPPEFCLLSFCHIFTSVHSLSNEFSGTNCWLWAPWFPTSKPRAKTGSKRKPKRTAGFCQHLESEPAWGGGLPLSLPPPSLSLKWKEINMIYCIQMKVQWMYITFKWREISLWKPCFWKPGVPMVVFTAKLAWALSPPLPCRTSWVASVAPASLVLNVGVCFSSLIFCLLTSLAFGCFNWFPFKPLHFDPGRVIFGPSPWVFFHFNFFPNSTLCCAFALGSAPRCEVSVSFLLLSFFLSS